MTEKSLQTPSLLNNFRIKAHLSLLIGTLTLLYWEAFGHWIHIWRTVFSYSYGFIIPLLSFYMIWARRDILQHGSPKPSKSGLLVVIAAVCVYVIGQAGHVIVAKQLSFIIIIPGIVLYYFGFDILRRLAVPLLILIFMLPYGEFLEPYLQLLFAVCSAKILLFFDAPILLEGYYIHLPNLVVEVDNSCSGIRSLTALLPIGFAMSYVHFDSWWKKILVVSFSAMASILANFFRILSILIFALAGNESFVRGTPHRIHGYIFFLVALCMFFGCAVVLKRLWFRHSLEKEREQSNQIPLDQNWLKGFSAYGNVILIVLVVLIPVLVHARLTLQHDTPLAKSFKSFPYVLGKWHGSEIGKNEWYAGVVGASDNLRRVYDDGKGNKIKIFVSYLPRQFQGNELVYYANPIFPTRYRIIGQDPKEWNLNLNPIKLKLLTSRFKLIGPSHHEMLHFWFLNTDHYAHSKYMAKFYMTMDSLVKNLSYGALFVVISESSSFNDDGHVDFLENFLGKFMCEMSRYLPS
jgi:EpsI family protein